MPNKKISQLDVRSSPTLADLLAIADPSTGYAYKITGTNLQTVLEIPNKVPYTGATASVNLGAYNITATNIIRAGGLATQFLKADGSVDSTTYMNRAVYDTDGNGVVDAAEKMQTIGRNATGATLYKGTIVYISGSTGNRPNFVKAQANSEATSAGTFGVVVSDIANNSDGYVATIGTLADLDTRTTATNPFTSVTLADGDTIYLDPNTAGYVTNVKPSAPNHIVYVGKVVRTSPTLGTIVYRIQNGYELSEIHDVSLSLVANNDVLVYESSSTLWKNKSIATILGYTPADDSLVVHLAGAENITGVKTFQNAIKTTTGNNLLNTGGGNTVIGYTADPASSATYKLDVNGYSQTKGMLVNSTATREFQVLDQYGVNAFKVGLNGQFATIGGYALGGMRYLDFVHNQTAANVYIRAFNDDAKTTQYGQFGMFTNRFIIQPTSTDLSNQSASIFTGTSGFIGYFTYDTTPASAAFAIKSTTKGFLLPQMTTTEKNAISTPATSLLVYDTTLAAFQYYTGSAWAGIGGISGSGTAGQVTYWSGTSAVTGSSNLFWDNTNGRLGIGTSSPGYLLDVSGTIRIKGISTTDGGVLGSELLSNSGWTLTGWSGDFTIGFTHTIGNTNALTNTLAAIIGNYYYFTCTITNRTAGTITINYGGISFSASSSFTNGNKAISTTSLSIVPTTDFDGTVVISIKQITSGLASLILSNNSGAITNEIRASFSNTNIFIGLNAGSKNITGTGNVSIGLNTLQNNISGQQNTAIGTNSLVNNTIGNYNTVVGYSLLTNNTTGSFNSAFSVGALNSNTSGNDNTAIGFESLNSNTSGSSNSSFGKVSLKNNTTGSSHSAFGNNTLFSNTSGTYNNAFGNGALYNNTTASYNSAFGNNALFNITTGSNLVAVGVDAGRYAGSGTAANQTSSNSIYLGYQSRASANGNTNEIVIGYNIVGNGSNSTTIGNSSTTLATIYGNLLLNTTTDGGQRLQVIGSMRVGTTAASAMYWDDTNARLIIGNTSGTARLDVGASTTSASALRIRSGTAPTSPNDGDIWYDGTNIYIRVGTTTKTFTII